MNIRSRDLVAECRSLPPLQNARVLLLFDKFPTEHYPSTSIEIEIEIHVANPFIIQHSMWNPLADFCWSSISIYHLCMEWIRLNLATFDEAT